MRRPLPVILSVLFFLLALTGACSTREPQQETAPHSGVATAKMGPHGAQTITVVGDAKFRYRPSTIRAKPGRLRITLVTRGGTPHDLEVEPMHANTGLVSDGQRKSVTVTLHRGTYRFICTLHVNLGMTGKIVVS